MPIKGLSDRNLSFPEIGSIRKGAPKDDKGQLGKDLTYFRAEFDEEEKEAAKIFVSKYGPEPREINILLPFDEIERCWDNWLEAYTAGRMVARSDGESFVYLVDTSTGEVKVRDSQPYTKYQPGQAVGTYKDGKGNVQHIYCEPVGRLKVVIPELQRLAYMTVMTTSVHDIANLSAQLEALKAVNGGRLAGIPMVLRRRPKKISTPKPDGTRARYTKWMLSIEADPGWVKAKLLEVKQAALPGNGLELLPETVDGQFSDGEDEGYFPDEEERDIPSQPVIDEKYDVDLKSPEAIKAELQRLVEKVQAEGKKEPLKQGQKGIVISCLEYIMEPGDVKMKRHAFLQYVFGEVSSKDLTDVQYRAIARYIKPQKRDTGEYVPEDPIVIKEINNMLSLLSSGNDQGKLF